MSVRIGRVGLYFQEHIMTPGLRIADVADLLEKEGLSYISSCRLAKQIAAIFEPMVSAGPKVVAVNINEVGS